MNPIRQQTVKIVICSTNPAKVAACRTACKRIFPMMTISTKEMKGLVDQPIGQQQTKECALLRAKFALKETNCDYGIGLEGGVSPDGWLINCAAVVDKTGKESHVFGLSFPLPKAATLRIVSKGEEMGPVMDDLFSKQGSSKSIGGAIGQLTDGIISRAEMWESPLICAFIPFLNQKMYSEL